MSSIRTALCVLLCLVVIGCVAASAEAKKQTPGSMSLEWRPTTEISELGPLDLTGIGDQKVSILPFDDAREHPTTIGENREDEPKTLRVATSDDVGAFVATAIGKSFERLGLLVDDEAPDLVITGEVRRFFVVETNTYVGDVSLWVTVSRPDGEQVWRGLVHGGASRFGRSYKIENYNEVFSDSTLSAAVNLLKNPTFTETLRAASPSR